MQQGLGTSSQTRVAPIGTRSKYVVTDLVSRPAIADAVSAHGADRGISELMLGHPLMCLNRSKVHVR